ncbi:hypothetical protein PM082_009962 [Marasmius tenuissimus]|nr:hypothetical protein PM082_009962 [Marasmius tenuissimus]
MERKFGIKPLYGGLFFNFCLNGERVNGPNPVPRVFCEPHIDFKNLALAVCMIFVYGHFDHREKCWIVIWEAGIALELPMGVFVLYPSSLFLHFNVDIDNLNFLVTDGVRMEENQPPTIQDHSTASAGIAVWIMGKPGRTLAVVDLWFGSTKPACFRPPNWGTIPLYRLKLLALPRRVMQRPGWKKGCFLLYR